MPRYATSGSIRVTLRANTTYAFLMMRGRRSRAKSSLTAHRQQLGVAASECLVGIETAHNLGVRPPRLIPRETRLMVKKCL
jgi:hypothetical protein